jgi:hypothetical protein
LTELLFDPTHFAGESPFAPGSALRRWLKRLGLSLCIAFGIAAAVALFAPLLPTV